MGAGSHINVSSSPASSSLLGGKLILNNSTLTRHTTGCDNALSWGGVHLNGDFYQPQLTFATSHQPGILMYYSKISYADVGINAVETSWFWYCALYGFGFQSGGGIIQMPGGSSFLNNTKAVAMYPYRNFDPINPSVEIGNISFFHKSLFEVNDAALSASAIAAHHPLIGIAGAGASPYWVVILKIIQARLTIHTASGARIWPSSLTILTSIAP